jgi:hypothetical protein
LLRPGFGGQSNPALIEKVRRLVDEALRLTDNSYAREKAGRLIEWVEIACSPRRHAKWGLDRVEHFAFEEAYKVRHSFR